MHAVVRLSFQGLEIGRKRCFMGVKLPFTSLLLAMKLLLNCGVSFFYGGEESDAAATSCGGRAPRNLRDGNAPVKKDISGRGGEIKAVVEKKRKRASGRCSITEPARLSVTVLPLLVGHRGKVNRKEVTRGRKLETPNRGATSRGEDSKEGGGRKGKAVLRHRSSVMIPRLLFTCSFLRSGKAAFVLYLLYKPFTCESDQSGRNAPKPIRIIYWVKQNKCRPN
ncbi:hypothetical protein B296_00049828 [Ensete ventricosum]|uniref:Uncharacterized protein n=1 Tax=Ensete ventricosum TaxID=4639 RepID=A0A426X056_ENSVE|nr:hypothetical protein B296_00049828 [Ensete ventricosum]